MVYYCYTVILCYTHIRGKGYFLITACPSPAIRDVHWAAQRHHKLLQIWRTQPAETFTFDHMDAHGACLWQARTYNTSVCPEKHIMKKVACFFLHYFLFSIGYGCIRPLSISTCPCHVVLQTSWIYQTEVLLPFVLQDDVEKHSSFLHTVQSQYAICTIYHVISNISPIKTTFTRG